MVAMNVWPTDASDGSVSSEARWRKMARGWQPTGVNVGTGGELAPTLAFPNLTVKSGSAWVDGAYCELLGDQVLAVTANGLCVVRFDPAANTAQLLYLDGASTPSQSPTGIYEMAVAKITGSTLTDARNLLLPADPARGLVHRPVQIVADQTGLNPGGADMTGFSALFTAVAGRWYRANWSATIQQNTGPGTITMVARIDTNMNSAIFNASLAAGQLVTVTGSVVFAASTKQVSNLPWMPPGAGKFVQLQLSTSTNTATIWSGSIQPGRFWIEDIGSIAATP
jgi:hypothetical protein